MKGNLKNRRFIYDVLTLLSSMGVLMVSGSASILFRITTSCLFRPLRLDFFCASLVISEESFFFFFNEYGNKWQKGAVLLSQRNFMYSTINFKSNPAITFWFVYLPGDERDSVKWKSLLSVVCFRVFSHLRRSSSINGSFFLSVPCSRSPTYSSISSAFSMDRMYLGVENKHNYYLSNIKCMKKTMKKHISHAWIPKKTTNCNIRFSRPWNQD